MPEVSGNYLGTNKPQNGVFKKRYPGIRSMPIMSDIVLTERKSEIRLVALKLVHRNCQQVLWQRRTVATKAMASSNDTFPCINYHTLSVVQVLDGVQTSNTFAGH